MPVMNNEYNNRHHEQKCHSHKQTEEMIYCTMLWCCSYNYTMQDIPIFYRLIAYDENKKRRGIKRLKR